MSAIDLHILLQKLDRDASNALERAAASAVRNSHEAIELAHWIAELAKTPAFAVLVERAGVAPAAVAAQADAAVAELGRGRASGAPAFGNEAIALAREAFVLASLNYGRDVAGPADLLAALAKDASLRVAARGIAPALRALDAAAVDKLAAEAKPAGRQPQEAGSPPPIAGAGGEDFLGAFTEDLTAAARADKLDPVIGRDDELRQVVDILMRRRQNNPILVGEAGVGKTAIVEALALRIAAGDVPERLRDVRLLVLDMTLMQAGAGVKGEFERRLKGVVAAVKASPEPVILFIDEAHSIVGAGGAPGGGSDAANILKPPLARGELRTIGATTWSEYKRHIEKDPALTRRFQAVKVGEPDVATAVQMLRSLAPAFAAHHGVAIRDEAVRAAVALAARYIPARQLPDKAVSLIDTAAASVAMSRQTEPPELAGRKREAELLAFERDRLAAEPPSGAGAERAAEIAATLDAVGDEIAALEARLAEEARLATEADRLEAALANGDADADAAALEAATAALAALQGEAPLVLRVVDREAVAQVVARWTGVPVGRLVREEIEAVRSLRHRLAARVVGQDAALATIASAMRTARAGLGDPRRPPGVFLLVGTSGVGKTETALALADIMYGGEHSLTVMNMSEFKEEHKVSLLLGSPPGYVGYGEGGVLTEAVRRRPYGVLLLDEIDKAHPGVQDVFYQLFDKGTLRDGEGRDVDFKNTTIAMTANTGSETLARLAQDPDTMPDGAALEAALKDELLATFKPAFLGRTTVVPYLPLSPATLARIVELQVGHIAARVRASYGASLTLTEAARAAILSSATASEAGARAIETRLSRDLLPALSSLFLDAIADGQRHREVVVDADAGGLVARGGDSKILAGRTIVPAKASERTGASEAA